MSERNPFRVMCAMWGVERAVRIAKQIGLDVPEKEVAEQMAHDREFMSNVIHAIKGDDEDD